MLYQLTQYAKSKDLPCMPGYARKEIRAIVTITRDGRFLQAEPCEWSYDLCPTLSFSEMIAGGVTRSHFLVDTVATILGLDEKSAAKQKAFIWLHDTAAEHVPLLKPLSLMMHNGCYLEEMAANLSALKLKPTNNITFRLAGEDRCLVERDEWKEWWLSYRESLLPKDDNRERMRCFVTGEMVIPAATHPKLKLASVGGQSAGSTLIGFDKKSFASFGLKQSANAACSEDAAAVYAGALDDLIVNAPRPLAEILMLHWMDRPVPPEEDPFGFFAEPQDAEAEEEREKAWALHAVRRLVEAVRTGERPEFTANRYHALLLSGTAGRAMVRGVYEGELTDLYMKVGDWFDGLTITGPYGGAPADPPRLFVLLTRMLPYRPQTSNKDMLAAMNKQLSPLLARIWESILRGSPFPQEAANRALQHMKSRLQRSREDGREHGPENLDRICCAILKLWHNRAQRHGLIRTGGVKMETRLNTSHPSPAYHAGRLLAVLNHLQHTALGDVGADVVQRFFSAASVMPGMVVGRLIDGAQPHLGKLRREEKMGLYVRYQQLITDIMSRLDDQILDQLDFTGQTLFALGYYHQSASLFEKRKDSTIEEKEE